MTDATIEGFSPIEEWAWWNEPASWNLGDDGKLTMWAAAGSDLFFMPEIRNINCLSAFERPIKGDFTLSVWVNVKGDMFADAAGILLRSDKHGWLKVCIERSQSLKWTVESVVSSPYSDEARGPKVSCGCGGLLLTREGPHIGILWSEYEAMTEWEFLRAIWWPCPEYVQVGLFAQAPFSSGCTGAFSNLSLCWEATPVQR